MTPAAVKFLLLAPLASALFWESSPSPSAPARDGALGVVDNMINENKVTIFSNSKCTSSAKLLGSKVGNRKSETMIHVLENAAEKAAAGTPLQQTL